MEREPEDSDSKGMIRFLRGALIMFSLGLGSTLANASPQVVQAIVDSAARNGVPASVALGIAAHESGFNPGAVNVNTNGTRDWGVMQLNDTTVSTLGVSNPLDPIQNIEAGVGLIGKYIKQYSGDIGKALWAYANGPTAVARGNMTPGASGFVSYVTSYDPIAQGLNLNAGAGASTYSDIMYDPSSLATPLSLSDYVEYGGIGLGAIVIAGIALILILRGIR